MLHAAHGQENPPPSSPIRRLTQPALPVPESESCIQEVGDAEFVSSTPAPTAGARIRREAFSPNYFRTFFVEERELGRGGKGVVLLVRHQIDGCQLGHFACKRVPVGDDHAWLEKVLIEVELLAKLSHPNLVSYRHVWLEDVNIHRFGPNVACAFILQQYCNGGDLLQYIVGDHPKETTKEQLKAQMRRRSKGQAERPDLYSSQRRLTFEEIYSLFRDIVSGLAYLHGSNYVHRDLKPSNCLLHHETGKITCLISDFGEVQPKNAVRKSTGTTGTISYCAPEVLVQDGSGSFGNFTTKSDVFSLGMILYFLCFGRLPYINANTIQEELEDIDLLRAEITDWKGFQEERRERPDLPHKLYHLLKQMLALNPQDRPTAADVLEAMNQESNSGEPRRQPRANGGPLGVHEHRIQNLDSPIVPGTPVLDPLKSRFRDVFPEDSTSREPRPTKPSEPKHDVNYQTALQRQSNPASPLHQHAMTLSKSQDGFFQPDQTPTDTTEGDVALPAAAPPLLMPPPTTIWDDIKHSGMLSWHSTCRFYSSNAEGIVFLLRLGMFLVKMASLTRMCWPLAARLEISTPLLGVAAMDLGMPYKDTLGVRQQEGSRGPQSSATSRWNWSWGLGGALFILHFVILWSAKYWARPCLSHWD